jgi:hypothetical protein
MIVELFECLLYITDVRCVTILNVSIFTDQVLETGFMAYGILHYSLKY